MKKYSPLRLLVKVLPWWFIYLCSDVIFVLLYYIIRYRRKVVAENLAYAFPELSLNAKKRIAKKYFRNLCDMVLETFLMQYMDWEKIQTRFVGDATVLNALQQAGNSVLLCIPHQFNWEWGGWWLNHATNFEIAAVYQPIKNKFFDNAVRTIRSRYGTHLIQMGEMGVKDSKSAGRLTALLADQTPSNLQKCHWSVFFHRIAPFHNGFERIARITGQVPVFIYTTKIKRGHYRVVYSVPFEAPQDTRTGEITEAFVRYIEEKIRLQPETWLWSHRRWKRSAACPPHIVERLTKQA